MPKALTFARSVRSLAHTRGTGGRRRLGMAMGLAAVLVCAFTSAATADPVWDKVGETFGKTGGEMPGGVYRIALSRTDIKAMLDSVELKPAFALGGWLAFQKKGDGAMVIGDLVVTADEVNPVMAKMLAGGALRSPLFIIICSATPPLRCTRTSTGMAIP